MNYTYIVKCKDGTLYTGWTNDIEKRIEAHNAGKGAKYTKTRRPVELVYLEEFGDAILPKEFLSGQRKRDKNIPSNRAGNVHGVQQWDIYCCG